MINIRQISPPPMEKHHPHQLVALGVVFAIVPALSFIRLFSLTGGQRTAPIVTSIALAILMIVRGKGEIILYVGLTTICLGFGLIGGSIWTDNEPGELLRLIINALSCLALYRAGLTVSSQPDVRYRELSTWSITAVSGIISTVDLYFRVFNPDFAFSRIGDVSTLANRDYGLADGNFHSYKYGSIMFYDANYVAILLIIPIFLWLYYPPTNYRLVKFTTIAWLLAILASTFSRATWVVIAFILLHRIAMRIFDHSNHPSRAFAVKFLFYIAIISILSYIPITSFIESDDSGASKIQIFKSMADAFSGNGLFQLLFGYGFDRGWYIYSYSQGEFAHGLLSILLGQIGIIGTSVYLALFLFCSSRSGGVLILGIGFLMQSFSLIDPWDGSIFLAMGLATNMQFNINSQRITA